MKNLKPKHRGIGLLELMLALAVIATLLLMATRYYSSSSEAKKLTDVSDQLGIIQNAGNRWLLTHADYTTGTDLITSANSFKDFVDRDYLPPTYYNNTTKSSALKNPWGGDLTVNFTSTTMSITLKNVPTESAAKLQYQYKNILCQTGTINPTITCPNPDPNKPTPVPPPCTVKFDFLATCA